MTYFVAKTYYKNGESSFHVFQSFKELKEDFLTDFSFENLESLFTITNSFKDEHEYKNYIRTIMTEKELIHLLYQQNCEYSWRWSGIGTGNKKLLDIGHR